MKYGRKVLEAERKRTETSGGHALRGDDGYLKHNQAFPLAHDSRSPPPGYDNACSGVRGSDDADEDCAGRGGSNGGGDSPCAMGMSDHQPPTRYHLNHGNNGDAARLANGRRSPASRSLLASPVLKKNRLEATSPVKGDAGDSATRAVCLSGARCGLFGMGDKRGTAVNGGAAVTASRYAAPYSGRLNEGTPPYASRAGGEHHAVPTLSSRLRGCSSLNRAPLTLGLRPPVTHRKGCAPVTAGISPSKRSRWHSRRADRGGHDSTRGRTAARGEGEGSARVTAAADASASVRSSLVFCPSNAAAGTEAHASATCTTPPTTPCVMAAKQRVLVSPTPAPPMLGETATAKKSMTSPPLRAAVSPHSLGTYRQYRLAGESPQSVAQESPGYKDTGPHAAAGSPTRPEEAPGDLTKTPCPFPQPHCAPEMEAHALPPSGAKTSRYHPGSRGVYGSPLPHRDPCYFSGFINPRNDCYACSVLTLLLRSPCFCRALYDAHEFELAPDTSGTTDDNALNGSGKNDGGDMYRMGPVSATQRHRGTSFGSVHQVLLHFARLLEKPEKITYGIDMAPLRQFFSTAFFSGEQQDAHEFFLNVINKLEEESMEILKRRDATRVNGRDGSHGTSPETETNTMFPDGNKDEGKGGEYPSIIDSSRIWINRLLGGKLLNIIRCRNEGCGHEIATQDSYVNLCINLGTATATEADSTPPPPPPPPPSSSSPVAGNGDPTFGGPVDRACSTPPKGTMGELSSRTTLENGTTINGCNDVQTLLDQTLRYVTLDKYICDACGSSQNQDQGGGLLGPAPPILTIQLNRYSTVCNSWNEVRVVKDKTPVFINNELTLYALREEGQFDCDKKQLTPCVREAERVAKQRERHAGKRHPQEGEDTGGLPGDPSGAGEHAPDGSGVGQRHNKEEEDEDNTNNETHVNAIRYLYRLRGVVRHIGFSPVAGHYVAEFATDAAAPESPRSDTPCSNAGTEAHTPSRVWHIANDVRVEALPSVYLQKSLSRSTDSYLILYEKVAEEEVSCPVWRVLPREKN